MRVAVIADIWISATETEAVEETGSPPPLSFPFSTDWLIKIIHLSKGWKRDIFTKAVNKKIGPNLNDIGTKSDLEDFFDDTDTLTFTPYIYNEGIEDPSMPEADAISDYDRYIESEVILPRNGKELSSAKVVSRVK